MWPVIVVSSISVMMMKVNKRVYKLKRAANASVSTWSFRWRSGDLVNLVMSW